MSCFVGSIVNKREICEVLAAGVPMTAAEIIDAAGVARDPGEIAVTRTILSRLFKDSMICEVLPRKGREKLWMDVSRALSGMNEKAGCRVDGGTVECWSVNKPDRYRFVNSRERPLAFPPAIRRAINRVT
jgi:hypothetical protein